MRKLLIGLVWSGAMSLALLSTPAFATTSGWCGGGVTSLCPNNGTNSPFANNPPNPFGFTSSPPNETGILSIDVLVPDNESVLGPFSVTGAASATATLFSATPWTSGNLEAYLGISASPANPIGFYLPSTQALDPGATGFFVYQASAGTQTLAGPAGPPNQLFDISGPPLASYLVGYMNMGANGIEAPAFSGAIFTTTSCDPGSPGCNVGSSLPVPEPSALALLGSELVILGFLWYRKIGLN